MKLMEDPDVDSKMVSASDFFLQVPYSSGSPAAEVSADLKLVTKQVWVLLTNFDLGLRQTSDNIF